MTTAAQFQPRRWLTNGHLQTIVGNFLPRTDHLPPATTEFVPVPLPTEMLALPHAVAIDRIQPSSVLCHCHWQPDRNHAVTVVLVHGLEGSSHSQYIIGNANKLFHAGCNVVRMNMRNCGSSDALTPTLYHSGMSGDVKAVLAWLVDLGCTRVVLAGYSMGGNLVLKAAGELAECTPSALIGAIAVSPPMDLAESADALHHWTNRIYERRFLRGLIRRYRRKRELYPAIFPTDQTDRVHSIRDFDEYVMTPYCGFTGAADYYARSSASNVIDTIAVPTLILHACDDPFIRLTATTRTRLHNNPNTTLLEPPHGGHCAFLEDPRQGYDGRWAESQLLQFVTTCAASTARLQVPLC